MKKHILIQVIAACCFSLITNITNAATYYASPTGTGVGTLADPCNLETGYALIINPGDTLYLRGGQYDLIAKTNLNRIGTAEARICIWAYPGETPIFDFRNEPYGQAGFSFNAGATYMHIKGWVVRYAGDNGIINNGNYNIIENCVFYGNCDSGLQHKGGGGNLIKNCDSYANFDYESMGTTGADYGGNADGFADKQFSNTNPNTYDGCRSWNNSDDGWDLFERIGNVIIKNSICYQNGPASFNLSNHPRLTTDAAWFSQFPATVTNDDGGSDYITLTTYKNYGNGNGFKLGGNFTDCDVTVTNCLSVDNTVRGYDQNNNYGTMTLYNNTAYANGANYGFNNNGGGTLIIKNCVNLTGSYTLACQNVTNVNNSWNTSGVVCNTADFESIDTTLVLSPRQADGSLAITTFMHLIDGSDLIDKGIDVAIAFSGTAIDLGCYEKGVIDQFPGTVTTPINKSQTLTEGGTIEDIVFTWGAGATSLEVTGLPSGLSTSIDNVAKTLTISGTPSESGVFDYTVSTVGGTTVPNTVTGRLVINSASAKKIAYVTTLDAPADALILAKLYANTNFAVTTLAATTVNDYSGYDLIILSAVPNSSSAGLVSIEALDIPKLLLKPFQLGATRWNWGIANNLGLSTTIVSNKTHEIFTGLSFTGANSDELQLFSTVTNNGITGISTWVGSPTVNTYATTTGVEVGKTNTITVNNIVEFPIGSIMGAGTTTPDTIAERNLMIGLSEYSTANLTANATQLIENSCYYLMGMPVPGYVGLNTPKKSFSYTKTNNLFTVECPEEISSIQLFNIQGMLLSEVKNCNSIDISSLPKGIYVVKINSATFSESIKIIK